MSKHYMRLTINGVEWGLSFKTGFVRVLAEVTGKDFFEFVKEIADYSSFIKYLPEILYAAMASNCTAARKEIEFTLDDTKAWADDMDITVSTTIMATFLNAFTQQTDSPEVSEKKETFQMGGSGKDMPGSDDDASVGTGSIHVQRPPSETEGVQRA